MDGNHRPSETRIRTAHSWTDLVHLCKKIHHQWYIRKDEVAAKRYLGRLNQILRELPDDDMAIAREDGLAWSHQLRGETEDAIKHRVREILLIEMLHEDVRRHAATGQYDESTIAYVL